VAAEPSRRGEVEESRGMGKWVSVSCIVLSLLGLADSVYLSITHFAAQVLVCSANSVICCACVITGPWSSVFGIPVAFLGLAFFVAMVVINLPVMWRSGKAWVVRVRLWLAVGGMGFVLYLLYVELFIKKFICEYCTGVHILTFALFYIVVTTYSTKRRELSRV
jgi:uncharacterized membrane protein